MVAANEGIVNVGRGSRKLSGQGSLLSFGGVEMELSFGAYLKQFSGLGGVSKRTLARGSHLLRSMYRSTVYFTLKFPLKQTLNRGESWWATSTV